MTNQTLVATGPSASVKMIGKSNVSMIFTVAGISGSVVVNPECSNDDTTFANLDENGTTTITTNGTYKFLSSQDAAPFVGLIG